MYAIFQAKGKQWRAEEGATLELPSLDAEPGDRLDFEDVLLAQRDGEVLVGRPSLDNASVSVEVVRHGKRDKIIVFKRKKRKGYRRKQGHRQQFTEVRVVALDLEDAVAPAPSEVEEAPAPEPEPAPAEEPEAEPGEEEAPAAEEVDITSAAEELATEHGIDVTELEGTGKDGRILKSDVQAAVDALEAEVEEEEEEAEPEEGAVVPEDVDITSAAEELAIEHGIDVTELEGTGKDGRILKSDVQAAVDEKQEE